MDRLMDRWTFESARGREHARRDEGSSLLRTEYAVDSWMRFKDAKPSNGDRLYT